MKSFFDYGASSFGAQKLQPNVIHSTKHYHWFNYANGNRDINLNEYQRLKKNIAESGQLQPIMVNERGEVIDGQHRLAVCKELGLPINFIVIPGTNIQTAVHLNTAGHRWSSIDWINYYAKHGNDDYKQLLQFVKNSPFNVRLSITIAQGTLTTANYRDGAMNIKAGTWYCKSWESANELMIQISKVAPFIKNSFDLYVNALVKYNHLSDFDWNRFGRQVTAYPEVLHKIADYEQALEMIDKLYNYKKTRHQVPILHLYKLSNTGWAKKNAKAK
jgi:ParB-like nuclease domain